MELTIAEKSALPSVSGDEAVEYVPFLTFTGLDPFVGQTMDIFVHSRFISFSHAPIADRKLYGSVHYSPDSDLAAVVMHSGVLFVSAKARDSTRRQFCTTLNFFEALCCSESEYPKRVMVRELPIELGIQGVLISILFTHSPASFASVNRNGIRSQAAPPYAFSIRIANYRILTAFDEIPPFNSVLDIRKITCSVPIFCESLTRDVGIHYSEDLFLEVFSLSNICNRFFAVYRLFFDVHGSRYELALQDEEEILFILLKFHEAVPVSVMKRRSGSGPDVDVVGDRIPFWEIEGRENSIKFGSFLLGPVDNMVLMTMTGKLTKPQFWRN
jgi:hypothetical protein